MDKDKEMSEEEKVTHAKETSAEGRQEVKVSEADSDKREVEPADTSSNEDNSAAVKAEAEDNTKAEADNLEKIAVDDAVLPGSDASAGGSEPKMESKDDEPKESVEEGQEEDEHQIDFSNFSKRQLIEALKEISQKDNLIKEDNIVQEIKNHYDEYYQAEKAKAKKEFLDQEGDPDEFQYRHSEEDREFFKLHNDFKAKRIHQIKELELSKEKNLAAKNQLLQQLRDLVDSEETTLSINTIKSIQKDWKKIGPVPAAQNKNLWASYNALMDRFYDNRSIYFELKELDRKKNLEHKLEICQKAEMLDQIPDLKEAIRALNELHEEFKHIGPVPLDEQEGVWQRFKTASDTIYAKRKNYFDSQVEVFGENLKKKEELITRLEQYQDYKADKIKDWNLKTKEILAIQKEWETVGPVPRDKGKEINKTFWGHFKQFFQHKNQFFKELDELRIVNKEKAETLIERAQAYAESTDWQKSANELIQLQQEWKNIGPTPEKVRDDLYKRFKNACDTFFENRRKANKEINKEFDTNLSAKKDICVQIKKEAETGDTSVEKLEGFIDQFNEIGFVPRKNIKEIAATFKDAVDAYANKLGVEGKGKEEFLFRLNLTKLQGDPNGDKVLNKKEHGIRKQISDLENNITLWKNNLEFFASSKTADKLKDQFDEKIEKAEQEIDKLKKKLSIIREF
ncbi:DUF349 domain-containing protein [Anditalea andensis]|uniref:Chromosome segregation protein n=1 Tax=Anditalea andensis TaxID=1048983 RepID=A0A074L2C3_9BACT|nr:DUF349 domain-containing protein [Anditalea andensis]KEO74023.1 hypothetical protein EL17_07700 [Anditalea andensis]